MPASAAPNHAVPAGAEALGPVHPELRGPDSVHCPPGLCRWFPTTDTLGALRAPAARCDGRVGSRTVAPCIIRTSHGKQQPRPRICRGWVPDPAKSARTGLPTRGGPRVSLETKLNGVVQF